MRRALWHRSAMVAALVAVAAFAPGSGASAVGGGGVAGENYGLRAVLQAGADDLHDLGITGVQAMTVDDYQDTWAGAGDRDLRTGAPMPRNGYFRMGSNAKTFAAVVVLQLVAENRMSLDDPVERWLPGVVSGTGNDGSRVTVRHLLQHTSGIYNYTNELEALYTPEEFLAHRFDHHDPRDLVAIAMKHEPVFAPGEGWDYSNTNYVLAGMIIEEVTGRSWAAEVHHRIAQPLGLRRTFSPGDWPHLPYPHAKGYTQFEEGGPLLDTTSFNPTITYAAGDLVTTPADLVRFWRALLGGDLLGPAQLAEMQRTVRAEPLQNFLAGARYGLGIIWMPSVCGGLWGHGGAVPGMSTINGATGDGRRATVVSLSTQLADTESIARVNDRSLQLVEDTLCR